MVIHSAKQQATFLFTQILQEKDFLNTQLINEIEVLHGQSDNAFTTEFWKNLIAEYPDKKQALTDFIHLYLEKYPQITQAMKNHIYSNIRNLEYEYFDSSQFVLLSQWLHLFKPYADHNITLVWRAFQQYPLEIFPFLINLSHTEFKIEDIEILYTLCSKNQCFATDGMHLFDFINHYYDQFPQLLLALPERFKHTKNDTLRADLLIILSMRKTALSTELQNFILQCFDTYQSQHGNVFYAAIDALKKCKDIVISKDIITTLATLLHDNHEVWYLPMSAMRALHGLGIQDDWFKQHLLDALDDPYGCDGETPLNTSIELLIQWQEQGLYAADKIIQLLKKGIEQDNQELIKELLPYLKYHTQFTAQTQPLLWNYLKTQQHQDGEDYWIDESIIEDFLELSHIYQWQITDDIWKKLFLVIQPYLECTDRDKLFDQLKYHLNIQPDQIEELKQWCHLKDLENSLYNA